MIAIGVSQQVPYATLNAEAGWRPRYASIGGASWRSSQGLLNLSLRQETRVPEWLPLAHRGCFMLGQQIQKAIRPTKYLLWT